MIQNQQYSQYNPHRTRETPSTDHTSSLRDCTGSRWSYTYLRRLVCRQQWWHRTRDTPSTDHTSSLKGCTGSRWSCTWLVVEWRRCRTPGSTDSTAGRWFSLASPRWSSVGRALWPGTWKYLEKKTRSKKWGLQNAITAMKTTYWLLNHASKYHY